MRKTKLFFILLFALTAAVMGIPTGYFVLPNSASKPIQSQTPPQAPHGVITYLINLDRSKERLEFVLPKIQQLNLPFQRIAAVDGSKLTSAEFAKTVDLSAYHNFLGQSPKNGIIGCSLSHIKTWETFLASNYEYALIFEDDVSFDAAEVLATLKNLEDNPQYWDIANLEVHHRGMPLTIKKFANHTRMVVYLIETTHTGAYLINRIAAEKLLSKALPIKMAIDHYFTRSWELNLKYVGVEPRIVKQTFGDSEIETSKRTDNNFHTNFKQKLIKRVYKIQTNTIRFIYNLWNVVCAWQKS